MTDPQSYSDLDIAVIGMACRFPDADSPDQFWSNLIGGKESIRELSPTELEAEGIGPHIYENAHYVKAASILEDIDMFDASFFDVTPIEAATLDPQHRIFLETTWKALEDAGYNPYTTRHRIGLFAGSSINTYWMHTILPNPDVIDTLGINQIRILNAPEFLATRAAFKLNLRGPAVNLQTACSTSLVAIHLASQALLSGECSMALAGGVTVRVPHATGYFFQEGMINSPDGHCRAFDEKAAGTITGNGCGVVVLKPLLQALEDGDSVYAVLKGSAINNDGNEKIGFTAPSELGQTQVLTSAWQVADVEPSTLGYFEAHGTATPMGDPIEIRALQQALKGVTGPKTCFLGSVKTNLGHLDAAAGVAGFIKAALALKHRQIPPSLHFNTPNPLIDFSKGPFRVATQLQDWPKEDHPRRAGISSFGIGGTNAHVVLEEPPVLQATASDQPQLLFLSAACAKSLETHLGNLAHWLETHPEASLADVAFTLREGRKECDYRQWVVAGTTAEAAAQLRAKLQSVAKPIAKAPELAFLLPGQGVQFPGMAKVYYETIPAFQSALDLQLGMMPTELGATLRDLLLGEDTPENASRLARTEFTQPAIFLTDYAAATWLMDMGLTPQALLGHSLGELVGACLAGVLELRDALRLVTTRARLMGALPEGGMLAIGLSPQELSPFLSSDLGIALINGANKCVLSGPKEVLERFHKQLPANIPTQWLAVSHAFHSAMMDPMLDAFREAVSSVTLNPPKIPLLSNVTGTWLTEAQATDPGYWVDQIRKPVQFHTCLNTLLETPRLTVEVGPGRFLTQCLQGHARNGKTLGHMVLMPPAQQDTPDLALRMAGQFWSHGFSLQIPANSGVRPRRISLPTYPFSRERHWLEPAAASPVTKQLTRSERMEHWFFIPGWRHATSPVPANNPHREAHWLLFGNGDALEAALLRRLPPDKVVCVSQGPSFQKESTHRFSLDPGQSDAFKRLMQSLPFQPENVVYLWSIKEPNSTHDQLHLDADLDSMFFGPMHLLQHLASYPAQGETQITVHLVTCEVERVLGLERQNPLGALLQGLATTAPQEHPNLSVRQIDGVVEPAGGASAFARQLLSDFALESREPLIAWRGNYRWVPSFEASFSRHGDSPLRQGGTYLLVGGLGGIGRAVATYLFNTYGARLILTHRPGSAQAGEPLPDIPETHVKRVAVDASDFDGMAHLTRELQRHAKRIDGVFHMAGLPGDSMLHRKTKPEVLQKLAAKVHGCYALKSLADALDPDVVVLFSSLNAYTGGVGQADYSAANAFLDRFAQSQQQPWISINWDSWRGTGMRKYLDGAQSQVGFTPEEGCRALEWALRQQQAQVLVSTQEFLSRRQASLAQTVDDLGRMVKPAVQSVALKPRPDLSTTFAPPATAIEEGVAEIFSKMIGMGPIGRDDDFFELGGDSLLGTQMLGLLKGMFDVELPIASIFDKPSPQGLAELIEAVRWQHKGLPVSTSDDREGGEI